MGNGYNQHLHHHHPHSHGYRPTFLPMLCSRPSIRDVSLPMSWRDGHRSRSDAAADDPLSPKISCMGQVKRSNRIAGVLPAAPTSHHKFTITTTTTPGRTPQHHNLNVKYFKLTRLFSAKNLTTTASASTAVKSCRRRPEGTISCEKSLVSNSDSVPISIEDLDPPLPVVRRAPKAQSEREETGTLWKRRSGGASLGGLQIKDKQLKRNHLAPSTDSATV